MGLYFASSGLTVMALSGHNRLLRAQESGIVELRANRIAARVRRLMIIGDEETRMPFSEPGP